MTALDPWFPPIEGKRRTITGPFAVVYGLAAAAFSLWYLYTSGFGLVSTETNRGFYLLFTSILVFLIFPAWRGAPAHRPSVVDGVMIVAAVACIGYWMDQYVPYAMFRVSDPNDRDLAMGAVAFVVILETSRRVLGPALERSGIEGFTFHGRHPRSDTRRPLNGGGQASTCEPCSTGWAMRPLDSSWSCTPTPYKTKRERPLDFTSEHGSGLEEAFERRPWSAEIVLEPSGAAGQWRGR